MNPAWLLPLAAGFPLLLTALLSCRRIGRAPLRLLPFAPLPALAAACLLPEGARLVLPYALLEASWTLDPVGRAFLLFTSLGWLMAGLYAMTSLRAQAHPATFAVPFLMAMSGNLALTVASDAVTFVSGFAVMSFASWGLVVHAADPAALRAGRLYLALVVFGELLVLPGMVSGALRAGGAELAAIRAHWTVADLQSPPLYLLCFGFAVKAGLFPFHFWLPIAHPAAPTPASAALSGCMVNAGLLGIIRFLPLGHLAMPRLASLLLPLAAIGLIGAPLAGLFQRHPKAVLAYSSISKMSLLILLLVPALRDPVLTGAALTVVCGYAAFHGLHKAALFIGCSLTPAFSPAAWIPLGLLTASFAGLPGLSGGQAKKSVQEFLTLAGDPRLHTILAAGAVAGALLLLHFLVLTRPGSGARLRDPARIAVWLVAVGTALTVPFAVDPAPFQPGPWLTAVAALLAAGLLLRRRRLPLLPAGDLIALAPPFPQQWIRRAAWRLGRAEQALSAAPGGLIQLAVLLLLIWVLRG